MPNASYGGSGNVAGAMATRTPWDPRNFPGYMKFTGANVPVSSKTPGNKVGLLREVDPSNLRTWAAESCRHLLRSDSRHF